MTTGLLRILLPVVSLLMLIGASHAQTALNETQRDEVRALVRDYILQNPEIIAEAITILEARQEQAQLTARQEAITALREKIYNSPNQIVLGNPEGDVTLVEFFDYNCGFCKQAHQDMVNLIKQDPDLRFVLKEFPVLGPDSLEAARVSVAAYALAPQKFSDFHMQLLLNPGQANRAKAMRVAENLGLDLEELENILTTDHDARTIQESYELADAIGIDGTPAYVLADEVVFGMVGTDQLKQAIAKLRNTTAGGSSATDQ